MISLKQIMLEDYDPAQDKELWEMSEEEFKNLIKSYESLRLTAYKLGDGMVTIGWGHAEPIGSSKYKVGQSISKQEAIQLFNTDYKKQKNTIASLVPGWGQLPQYIKFALINAKFRGEFKSNYKWAQGIINNDWANVSKNYSQGWGWPIPSGEPGTVAHRMTKNYNAFKRYSEKQEPALATLSNNDFKLYPNPSSINQEITIQVAKDKLPISMITMKLYASTGKLVDSHNWNNVSQGILQFNAPTTSGIYLIKFDQYPQVTLRLTVK